MSEDKEESEPSTLSEAQAEEAVAKAEYRSCKRRSGSKQNLMMAHLEQQQFQMQ